MRKLTLLFPLFRMVLLILALLSAQLPGSFPWSGTARAEGLTAQLQYAEGSYRINVGDVLSVNVYNQPDLSGNGVLVRSDGNASFNGVGELQVAGKTVREASKLLEDRIRELIRDPRISLSVSESKTPVIYLAGAVMRPGPLQSANPNGSGVTTEGESKGDARAGGATPRMDLHLSNVLAAAGGVKLSADLANVTVTRDGVLYKTVNLWELLRQGDSGMDVILQNGDSIYIPELPQQALDDETYRMLLHSVIGPRTFPVRVIGDVKQPGVYEMNATSPYLNSAIAKGGGFNPGANRKVIALRRFSGENQFSTLTIDPNRHDFILRPNDVIYISELKVYQTGHFSENMSRVLSPLTTVSSAFFGLAVLGRGFK